MSQLAFEYQDVAAVVCDKISMVGTNKQTAMHLTLQGLAEGPKKNMFMGGKSCIAAGDLRQLPPVQDKYVFEWSNLDGRPSTAPSHWKDNFKIYHLTEKMRCPDDIPFAALCDRVGQNTITLEDEEFLRSRITTEDLPCEELNDNFKSGKVAIITTTNEQRENINIENLGKCCLTIKSMYVYQWTRFQMLKITSLPQVQYRMKLMEKITKGW